MTRPVHHSIDAHRAALVCALIWAAAGLVGCSFDARDCTIDSPCPSDHVCDSATGICEPLSADGSDLEDTRQPDAQPAEDVAEADAGPIDPFDVPPADPDTSQKQDSGPLSGVCLVDSFSNTCHEDHHELNDTQTAATGLVSSSVGCDSHDESLIALDTSIDASICPGDRDWYKYELRTCRTRSYIVEVYVEPTKNCDPRSYAVEWILDDEVKARCVDPATDGTQRWQCQALGGGGKKLAYIVDSERFQSSDRHFITVGASELTNGQHVQFDYELRARIKP